MAYIYSADIFCDDCGEDICRQITEEGHAPADPEDQASYDSDEFPKYFDGTAESDTPEHCGCMDDCINAINIGDGFSIGVWLENSLTTDGGEYVIEAVRGYSNEVTELWAEWYDYLDFSVREVCEGCRENVDVDDLDEDNHCLDCRDSDIPNMVEI